MAQEFFIKSTTLEDKVRQLLPSQGGLGAGFDLSASTQIVPIVDLTESAEGSVLRQDLQTSLSLTSATSFAVTNTTSTLINTTGYFRVFGSYVVVESSGAVSTDSMQLTDGTTTKIIQAFTRFGSSTVSKQIESYDFIVFIKAGDSFTITSSTTSSFFNGSTRQIADIDGNLVNP